MPVNLDKIKAKEEELARAGRKFWSPKDGKSHVRIAPPPEGFDEFYAEGGFHYHVGSGDNEKTFPCPRLGQEREDCWLCQKADELSKGDDEEREEADEMTAGKKFIIPILDMDNLGGGIQFWLCGFKAFKQILSYFSDPQYGDISDPDTGSNLTVTKTGKGMKTEYDVKADKNESKWPEDYDDLLDELVDPWTILTYDTNSAMEASYNGVGATKTSSRRGEDADEPAPRRSARSARAAAGTTERSKPPRGEAPAFEKAEEPEEAEEGEAEEPEAEAPVARHAGSRRDRGTPPPVERSSRPEPASRRLGRQLRK